MPLRLLPWLLALPACTVSQRVAVTTARPAEVIAPREACLVCARDERPCELRFERPWPFDSSSRAFPVIAVVADGRCQSLMLDTHQTGRRSALHFDLAAEKLEGREGCLLPSAWAPGMPLKRCDAKWRR